MTTLTYFQTTINNLDVQMILDSSDGQVSFAIEESYEKLELSPKDKLAILRWLLKTWEDVKLLSDTFYCLPLLDDNEEQDVMILSGCEPSWRAKIYEKMGFFPDYQGGEYDYLTMYFYPN